MTENKSPYGGRASPHVSAFESSRIKHLEQVNEMLQEDLKDAHATIARQAAHIEELEARIESQVRPKPKPQKVTAPYSPTKSNGIPKAKPAQSIRSYTDFKAMQDYFLEHNRIRDWMLWTMGVSIGLRISDLFSMTWGMLLQSNGQFRDRIIVREQKTSKLNNILITEAVRDAAAKYLDSVGWDIAPEDYVFASNRTGGQIRGEVGWRIISNAAKAIGLPINVGSHTMRKSFANIAACCDRSTVDMNGVAKIQGLLNHSDQRVTMRYLGTYMDMYDRARIAVSDFVMGKTDVDELRMGEGVSLEDVVQRLDELGDLVSNSARSTN